MKKLLLVLGILAGLAVVALIASTFFLGSIVKAGVNTVAPKITGTKVELAGARVSPLTGSGTLTGLFVGNPPGWQGDKAFYLGNISLKIDPMSLFRDHIIIDEIIINQPEFVYETKIVSSNIKELLEHIEAATGGPATTTEKGSAVKFVVKKFSMSNGTVSLGGGGSAITVPMPPLTMTDLGVKEGGITADQLAIAIMRNILGSVVGATTRAAGQIGSAGGAATIDAVSGAAQKAGQGIRNLFNKSKDEDADGAKP